LPVVQLGDDLAVAVVCARGAPKQGCCSRARSLKIGNHKTLLVSVVARSAMPSGLELLGQFPRDRIAQQIGASLSRSAGTTPG
jgi:hypothetical protein